MQYETFLPEMGKSLNITRSAYETAECWTKRVVFSALSKWFLSALWESIADGANVASVSHVKDKVKKKMTAYAKLFPNELAMSTQSVDDLSDYIYDVHGAAGSYYHSPYRVEPAMEKRVYAHHICWIRSPLPNNQHAFSGLGAYEYVPGNDADESEQLMATYGLSNQRADEYLKHLLKGPGWIKRESSALFEYFDPFRKARDHYFVNHVPVNTDLQLARRRTDGGYLYNVIRGDKMLLLPEWMIDEKNQWRTAIGLQMLHHIPPQVIAKIDPVLVNLELSFRLPAKEENFIRLYCWPERLNEASDCWHFSTSYALYPMIKRCLSQLGFDVKEIKP